MTGDAGVLGRVGRRAAHLVPRHPVTVVAMVLIAVQLTFRGWALLNGWFYGDDFQLLGDATGRSLGLGYLVEPHDSQLMPSGILAAWLVAQAGPFNWTLAASIILALQALAGLACWQMLVCLFGRRGWCLVLLSGYLFSTLTLTAFMWWAAAINAVPVQLAFSLAVTCHVTYLRTGRVRWALATTLALVLGLSFFVKAVLIVGPLVLLTLFWFTDRAAGWRARLRELAVVPRLAWLMYAVVVGGYLWVYVTQVPDPFVSGRTIAYGDLLDAMLRVSLGTGVVGGPWQWSLANPPLGQVATPAWAVTASWVVLAVGATLLVRGRRLAWGALVLAGVYLVTTYLLVAHGRAAYFGGFAGLELRYLADAVPVLVMCAGLLVLPLRDPASSPADAVELRVPALGRRQLAVLAVGSLVVVGVVVSSVRYVTPWTDDFPAKAYTQTVIGETRRAPAVIVDVPVPDPVVPALSYPENLPSRLFRPLGTQRLRAVTEGTDLSILNGFGQAFPAFVRDGGARSAVGPVENCGYPVDEEATVISMVGAPPSLVWWLDVSYLAAGDATLDLEVGEEQHQVPVRAGLHRLLVRGEGLVGDVTLQTVEGGTVVCVDQVSIGDVAPLQPLDPPGDEP